LSDRERDLHVEREEREADNITTRIKLSTTLNLSQLELHHRMLPLLYLHETFSVVKRK
jgi:hypothetical protein